MKGIAGLIDGLLAKGLAAAHSRQRQLGAQTPPVGFLVGNRKSDVPGEAGEPVVLSEADRRKHLYVLGATGCGKTNLLLRLISEEVGKNAPARSSTFAGISSTAFCCVWRRASPTSPLGSVSSTCAKTTS